MILFVPDSDGYGGADNIRRTDGADFTVPCFNTPLYERDTPNMSRAKRLKRGESAVSTLLNQIPVHLGGNNA